MSSPTFHTSSSTVNSQSVNPPSRFCDDSAQRRETHHEADVLVVGAGIAGCAIAVALGKQGRSVLLLEKSLKEPDRIVGELLQPGGVQALEQLGMKACLDGIDAIEERGYNVIYYGEQVLIPYPTNESPPTPMGRSFHHGRFIMKLREAAMANSNITVVETTVTSLITCSHTHEVLGVNCLTNSAPDCYFAHLTVIADGYASKLRKEHHPHTPRVRSKFWGLELIDADLPTPRFGHVVISDAPPVLLYQIGAHETRVLVDIPENLPSASIKNGGVRGYLRNIVLPNLPRGVQPSFLAAIEKGPLRSMPNSFLPPATNKTPGLIILGDALNMRHPLTGGGMTVAFNDVVVLRDLLSLEKVPCFSNTRQIMKQMTVFHWKRKGSSAAINILAQALYALFAANDFHLKVLQRGCFRYFQLGMIDGPVGLLAGIIKQPFVLFWHFFSVAFLSIWVMFADAPLSRFPVMLFNAFAVFWTACVVIFPYIFTEMKC